MYFRSPFMYMSHCRQYISESEWNTCIGTIPIKLRRYSLQGSPCLDHACVILHVGLGQHTIPSHRSLVQRAIQDGQDSACCDKR